MAARVRGGHQAARGSAPAHRPGRYTDDFTLPGMAHMAVVRSPYAHAKIKGISTKKAAAMEGVLGVFTGKDMKDAGFGGIPCAWVVPGSDTKTPAYPPIAIDLVRYSGNAVAIVVATDRYLARDAAEAVEVDYAPLPVVTDAEKATAKGQPQLHAEAPGNQCFHWKVSGGDVEAAFRSADVVVKERIINQRLIPNAMEPRAALAQYMSGAGEVTLWVTSQNPHIVRFLLSLDTGIPENKIRVIAPEVGGGFGSKIPHYPEDAMVVFASKTLGCPVKCGILLPNPPPTSGATTRILCSGVPVSSESRKRTMCGFCVRHPERQLSLAGLFHCASAARAPWRWG